MIDKLEKRWPDVELRVTNNRRCDRASEKSIDVRLLSSPLLHALDYSIFFDPVELHARSDFSCLESIIYGSRRLKSIRLGVYSLPPPRGFDKTQFTMIPQIVLAHDEPPPPTPQLQALKSISLSLPRGNMSSQYIANLHKVSSLIWDGCAGLAPGISLELHGLSPRLALHRMEGTVPNLMKLEFPIQSILDYGGNHLPKSTGDPVAIGNVLRSIVALEELQISNYNANLDVLWPAIVKHHQSLRVLRIRSTDARFHGLPQHVPRCFLSSSQLEDLQDSALTDLEIDIQFPAATRAWVSNTNL